MLLAKNKDYKLKDEKEKIHQIDCINHGSFNLKRIRGLDIKRLGLPS